MGPENETTRDDEMKEELSSSTSLESKPFKTYTPAFVSRTASPLGVAHTVQQLLDREIIILFDFYFVDFYTHNTRNKNALFTQHSFHTTHAQLFIIIPSVLPLLQRRISSALPFSAASFI